MREAKRDQRSDIMDQIGVAHLTWKRFLQRGLNQYGVNLKQVYLMRRLGEEEYLHPSAIAEELFCDRPTATVIVRNLERKGWVCRQSDPEDGKRVRVALTPAGAEKLASIPRSAYRSGATRHDPVACLSSEERSVLADLVGRLVSYLEGLEPDDPE